MAATPRTKSMIPTMGINFVSRQLVLEWDGPVIVDNNEQFGPSVSITKALKLAHELSSLGHSVAIIRRGPRSLHFASSMLTDDLLYWAKEYDADTKSAELWTERGYPTLRVTRRPNEYPYVAFCHIATQPVGDVDSIEAWNRLLAWISFVVNDRPTLSAYMQPARDG